MVSKIILVLLFLTACTDKPVDNSALVTITCYDINNNITFKQTRFKGAFHLINDPTVKIRSEKCIIERE